MGTVDRVDSELIAQALLEAAGLDPTADEIEALAESYGAIRSTVDKLYFGETADVEPGMVFIADPHQGRRDGPNPG